MMELREDPAVVLVYLVRQMAQARDELVVPQTEVDARRILYGAPADDHGGGPAPGPRVQTDPRQYQITVEKGRCRISAAAFFTGSIDTAGKNESK